MKKLSKTRKIENVKDLLVVFVFAIAAGISIKETAAYFNDSIAPIENNISMGSVSIELSEEHWSEEDAKNLLPKQTIRKDPVITNTGNNPAFVFLEVKNPVYNLSIVGEEGKKLPSGPHELFIFQAEKDMWELLECTEGANQTTYLYGYKNILYPGQSTVPLFEEVSVLNYLEGELEIQAVYSLELITHAIQSEPDEKMLSIQEHYNRYFEQRLKDLENQES